LLWYYLVTHYTQLHRVLTCVVILQRREKVHYELLALYVLQLFLGQFSQRLEKTFTVLTLTNRHSFPRFICQDLTKISVMVAMLIPLKAHLTQFHTNTQQTLEHHSFDILHSTSSAVSSLMHLVTIFPSLEIFEDNHHWILKLRTTHWTSHSHPRILLMSRPYLKTFGMQTFLTNLASRVTLTIHLLVTNRTHTVFLKWREIFRLLSSCSLSNPFVIMLLDDLLFPLGVF
jgi:hypothetical protein